MTRDLRSMLKFFYAKMPFEADIAGLENSKKRQAVKTNQEALFSRVVSHREAIGVGVEPVAWRFPIAIGMDKKERSNEKRTPIAPQAS